MEELLIEVPARSDEAGATTGNLTLDIDEGFTSEVRKFIAILQVSADGQLAVRAKRGLERFLEKLALDCPERETGPERGRWAGSVRKAIGEIIEALRAREQADPLSIPPTLLARAGAEAVRWNLVDRQATDAALWAWLDELFVSAKEVGVAHEFRRALAYHAAALDQQSLKVGFAAAQLIEQILPSLVLTPHAVDGALYGVDLNHRAVPVRIVRTDVFEGWRLVTVAAADILSDIHGELTHGQRRPGLEQSSTANLRVAVSHLRRQWSDSPPVRCHKRYKLNARLSIAHGYEQAMSILTDDDIEGISMGGGLWRITDLSRGGVGAFIPGGARVPLPVSGDLVAFCPEEGTRWHLGVVRRVKASSNGIEVGIATLSASPGAGQVEDGRSVRELCFCDPVRCGEAVRLVGPVGALGDNAPLFVMADGSFRKLRPLARALRGQNFDLRVYQVM